MIPQGTIFPRYQLHRGKGIFTNITFKHRKQYLTLILNAIGYQKNHLFFEQKEVQDALSQIFFF
jgi:hypothetical protein